LVFISIIFIPGFSSLRGDTDTFGCDGGTVRIRDLKYDVRKKCGEPTAIERLVAYAEVWIYNLGPSKFIRYLNFVGDQLVRIST
jgi:hypothetical protein